MRHIQPPLAVLCTILMLAPTGSAADQASTVPAYPERGFFGRFLNPYSARGTAAPNLTNSSRLESLLRAGNLYLSLQDAIALALENNLDLQLQRYGAQISDIELMATEAGGYASPASTSVIAGPSS